MKTISSLAVAAALACAACAASAQSNIVKVGITDYVPNSKTTGITGIGVPPGADADVGSATTVIFVYERMFTPNIGAELVIGIPPRIKAKATGTVAFLGDDVLSAKNVAPTAFVTYHFFDPGTALRPYLGVGINYTHFASVKSSLAPKVEMGDSTGIAGEAGISYAITKDVGLFASVAALRVKSKVVATGTTVLQTTVDFRPIVYSAGVSYQF
jgi:outer membrane protein